MSRYILGGGLSALVYAHYNPEYTVITPEFGGFIDSRYGRAFVVLHATDGMRQLFDELGVRSFEKRIQIGYYDQQFEPPYVRISLTSERRFANRYIGEKLPERFNPGKDLELSAPGDSWEALFVDSTIVDALYSSVNSEERARVVGIGDNQLIRVDVDTHEETATSFDHVVSTLPAPVFEGLVDVDWSLDKEPTTYAELPREKVPDRYLEEPWNLLYTVDDAVEYHRVARNMLSSRYYVECLGDTEVYGSIDSTVNPFGVISNEEIESPFPGISFLGRYAEWEHERRIDHVIEMAKEGV